MLSVHVVGVRHVLLILDIVFTLLITHIYPDVRRDVYRLDGGACCAGGGLRVSSQVLTVGTRRSLSCVYNLAVCDVLGHLLGIIVDGIRQHGHVLSQSAALRNAWVLIHLYVPV